MNQQTKKPTFLYVISGIFFLIIVSLVVYYLLRQSPSLTPKACTMEAKLCPDGTSVGRTGPNCEFTPCPTIAASPTSNEVTNWKTYVTQDNKYSFDYPQDWQIKDSSKNVDLYQDGKIQFQNNITVSKGEYKIVSYNPLAWGPGACLYPDSPKFEGPSSTYNDYVQIQGITSIYRRAVMPVPSEVKSKTQKWTICSKEKTSEYFVSVAWFGSAIYETPLNYDQKMLTIMDKIISTFKTIDQNQTSTTDKKIGYIRSITPNYDTYQIQIDYINWINDTSVPNGFRIENTSKDVATLPLEQNPKIIMQTYSHGADGNFNFNQAIPFSEFLKTFNSESSIKNAPYWIETKNGTVTSITEQYIP